jgi:nuclear pore complex protein Nup133
VQFPDAIVVASLAKPRESPDAQLLSDSGKPNLPFQDTIYLAKDRQDCFCGHASEMALKKDSPSSAVLFIKGYGIIQIKAMPPAKDEDDIGRHKVTAKSKLEQTTFFSTVPDNIIDFSIASRYSFALEDVEKAAVEISTGVLSSSYDYFEKATSSLDEQMNKRASALRVLISHLRKEYPPLKLDTTWQLLWNAEKLATAIALWNQYQETLQEQQAHPGAHSELLHLQVMIKYFHERTKTSWRPDLGETDPVRHFFLKEIGFMEHFLKGIWEAVQYLQARADAKDKGGAYRRMIQATDTALTAWETAFNFRAKNIEKYGLDPASFEGAILLPDQGQDLIPHFWTSTHNIVNVVRTLTAKVHKFTAELEKKPAPLEDGAMQLARDSPRLVQIVCQTHLERSRWAMAQTEEKTQETGKRVKEDFDKHVRPEFIYSLIDSGQAYEAMSLAEQYQDMATLARIVWNETVYLKGEKATTLSKMEQAECNVKLSKMKERIQRYFDQYGAGWAEEFYSRYIQENRSARVFDREYLNQAALTNFLRGSKSRARLAWINEVLGEQDYARAHKTLREVATTRETNVWCKKVELSIAKLSLLATKQASPSPEAKTIDERNTASDLASTTGQLKLIWIQEQLRDRFAPIITGALDDESAVELLMAEYGQGRLANRQAHQHLLRQGFDALIHNQVLDPALLIDVLTLMTYDEESAQPDITVGNEFAFALKVLVLSSDELHSNTQKNLLRLIWKRLAIKDDWAETNNTKDITDAQLEEFLLRTGVGTTFKTLLGMIGTCRRFYLRI